MARCMMENLPSFLWSEAMSTTIYTLNRCPTKAVEGKTPYEAWTRKKPSISHLRVFGCEAYAFVVPEKRKKMNKRSEKCIFVSYDNQHKGYKLYLPSSRAMFVSKDVKFNELAEEFVSYKDVDDVDDSFIAPNWMDINVNLSPQEQITPTQRITRSITLNKSLFAKIDSKNEPSSFKEASKHKSWMQAMNVKYEALMKNQTQDLVLYPNDRNVIGNKWIYKVKYNSVGEIGKYKARLVAKGFAQ